MKIFIQKDEKNEILISENNILITMTESQTVDILNGKSVVLHVEQLKTNDIVSR